MADRPISLVAVDAHTASWLRIDRDSGVDLVTRSPRAPRCREAPTHSINALATSNGGVRPPKTLTLPRAMANVVVLSPFGGRSQTHRNGARTRQASSRACAGHRNGARTWQPGRGPAQAGQPRRGDHTGRHSRTAMGTNQMDPATRIPAAVPVSPRASRKRPCDVPLTMARRHPPYPNPDPDVGRTTRQPEPQVTSKFQDLARIA